MSDLAINGGKPVFATPLEPILWPPVYEETAEELKKLYLGHNWSFYGEQEVKFNEEFAAYTGAEECVMMANGTVTLEVALKALGVGKGDEVIVPAHSWLATGEAVVYCQATPVIVDIEPDTLCLDPEAMEKAITPKTKAVIPVHLFGSMADMDKICAIAKKYNLYVIEDCAHSHGGLWDGKHTGTLGDVGSFSFQQSKLMASGEGGACITNNSELADKMGRLSHIGYQFGSKQGQKGTPPPKGMICYNYRVTDFQALILRSQLAHLDEDTALRAAGAEFLRENLNTIPGIRVQSPGRKATRQNYYTFCIMVDPAKLKPGIDRAKVVEALNAEGVSVFVGWGQPMYKQNLWTVPENMYRIESCANAERIVLNELMMLDLTWLMRSKEVLQQVVDAFRKVMAEYGC